MLRRLRHSLRLTLAEGVLKLDVKFVPRIGGARQRSSGLTSRPPIVLLKPLVPLLSVGCFERALTGKLVPNKQSQENR